LDNQELSPGHIQNEHKDKSSRHQNGQEDVKGCQQKRDNLQPVFQKALHA